MELVEGKKYNNSEDNGYTYEYQGRMNKVLFFIIDGGNVYCCAESKINNFTEIKEVHTYKGWEVGEYPEKPICVFWNNPEGKYIICELIDVEYDVEYGFRSFRWGMYRNCRKITLEEFKKGVDVSLNIEIK